MQIPEGVLLITVSIDVQASYVAVLQAGWTEEAEVWMLDYENIDGGHAAAANQRSSGPFGSPCSKTRAWS